MAATEPARELMRMADPPRHCGDCAVFALLRDVVTAALLRGSLVLPGQPIQAREALPAPGGGHHVIRDPAERLVKVKGTLYGCLATIDGARKGITAIARDGDGMTRAAQLEIRHHCGIIEKQAKKARETLAGTGLCR